MTLPEDLAADLPPPRDDEPASLRRDIIDELADHLTCAMDRESRSHSSVQGRVNQQDHDGRSAWRRVLQRFGNPSALAFRLWRDALQEQIMTQRTLLVFTGLLTVACCVAVGMAVLLVMRQQAAMQQMALAMASEAEAQEEQRVALERMLNDNRVAAEQLVAQAEAGTTLAREGLTQARAAQGDLIQRLQQLEAKAAEPADWNPADLKFVLGEADGPPGIGFTVRMSILAEGAGVPPLTGTSNAAGQVRFDRVRYGVYLLSCTAPWGEKTIREVSLFPGKPFETTIVCPPAAPEPFAGPVHLDLPDDLQDRPLFFRLNVGSAYRQFGTDPWSPRGTSGTSSRSRGFLGSDGPGLLFSSTGAFHSDGRRPASMLEPMLDVSDEGAVRGVRLPGIDYMPGGPVEFYTPVDLGEPETDPRRRLLAHIPDASLEPAVVRFRRQDAAGPLLVILPETALAALRAAFERADAAKAAGETRIVFAKGGASGILPLPPVLERLPDESSSFPGTR